MLLSEDRNPSGLVTPVFSEFEPHLLLQKHSRIYFPFYIALVCLTEDCLHQYEGHVSRNFGFKATPSHDASRDSGLEQT